MIKLLDQLAEGKIKSIVPEIGNKNKLGFSFPYIETLLEVSTEQTIQILESLTKKRVLKKVLFNKFLVCPKCKSSNTIPSKYCPKCNSANIFKTSIFEHLSCGYMGQPNKFDEKNGLICQKYKNNLQVSEKSNNNYDICFDCGYKCIDCGERFIKAVEKLRCLNCSEIFSKNNAVYTNVYSYQFNEEYRDQIKIKPQDHYQLKCKIEHLLKKLGYNVQSAAKVQGKAGLEYDLDIIGVKSSGIFKHSLLIKISISDKEVNIEEVLKLFAKAFDANINNVILIAIPKLSEDARRFANYYGVRFFEVRDMSQFISINESLQQTHQPIEIKCPYCEYKNFDEAKFCVKCGATLIRTEKNDVK
jgi:ribosomal protein L40E